MQVQKFAFRLAVTICSMSVLIGCRSTSNRLSGLPGMSWMGSGNSTAYESEWSEGESEELEPPSVSATPKPTDDGRYVESSEKKEATGKLASYSDGEYPDTGYPDPIAAAQHSNGYVTGPYDTGAGVAGETGPDSRSEYGSSQSYASPSQSDYQDHARVADSRAGLPYDVPETPPMQPNDGAYAAPPASGGTYDTAVNNDFGGQPNYGGVNAYDSGQPNQNAYQQPTAPTSPTYSAPPAQAAPAYGAPAYGAPAYGAPAYGAPDAGATYGPPSDAGPQGAYDAPQAGSAGYGTPDYGAPTQQPGGAYAAPPTQSDSRLTAPDTNAAPQGYAPQAPAAGNGVSPSESVPATPATRPSSSPWRPGSTGSVGVTG